MDRSSGWRLDCAKKGYLALSVTYRLAPCGRITGQHVHDSTPEGILSGRPEQQTNDMKAQVRAARADSLSTGWVGVIGGSSGGAHAARLAFDKIPTANKDWPHWCQPGFDDRPNVVAGLSGFHDYSERLVQTAQNIADVENYTNLCDPPALLPLSPVSFVKPDTSGQRFHAMIMINTENDPMPYRQILDLQCAFQNAGISTSKYQAITIPRLSLHAFEYWREFDGQTPQHRIRDDVLDFFQAHANDPP